MRAAFRFTRLAASILFTSVLLTLSGMLGWDTYRYHAALRALNDVRYVPEMKEQAALDYIKTANPFAQWLGRRQRVEEHLAKLRKDWHDADYNELLSFWREHTKRTKLSSRKS
jgi:hypothetical protein